VLALGTTHPPILLLQQSLPFWAAECMPSSRTSWRLLDWCSHQLNIFWCSDGPMSSECATRFLQLPNPGTNCVPIRNSIVARNVEPSPQSSLCCDYWSVVFKIHAHSKATMCSSPNHGVTDRAEGDHVHQPTPTTAWVFPPPNPLICSAAPCTCTVLQTVQLSSIYIYTWTIHKKQLLQ
jgi:hypothetical protein